MVPALFSGVLGWVFRDIVVKFMTLTAVFAVVAVLVPVVIGYIAPHLGVSSLNAAFAGLPSSIWFFLDFFNLGYGLPLLISAAITKFIIRRLPVVG